MKKILSPFLPALALLTLGGCASSSYLTTTEDDGMYYSSSDRVTAPAQTAPAATQAYEEAPAAEPGDVANPDYNGTVGRSSASSEYYDDDYYYASRLRRFHSPYRGIGMGYYDFAYTDPYWYGGAAYSPWGLGYGGLGYGGLYDPFFSPWGYGGVNINIGFGRPWGWGRPWGGYGYGYSPYDYGYGRPWGGYGYGLGGPWGGYGYGSGFYGGGGYYGGGWGNVYDRPGQRVTYGPRRSRTSDAPGATVSGGTGELTTGRRRVQSGSFTDPGQANSAASGVINRPEAGSRRRVQELPTATADPNASSTTLTRPSTRRVRDAQMSQAEQLPGSTPGTEPVTGGRRWRVLDNTNNGTATSPNGTSGQPADMEMSRRRRAAWSPGGGTPGAEQQPAQPRIAEQPRRQRLFDQSAQPSRSYEPSRSSESRRSYEPSRSSSGGSDFGGGGGSFGGGNSGGGGGRRR